MKTKKLISFLFLIMILLIPFNVEAKDYKLMLSFFSNGGTVKSGNIEINSGVIFVKNDIITDVTYSSNQTINHINSFDGITTFTLKKGKDNQTKNKEWYATNYINGKKMYFSNSKKYTVKEIVSRLGLDTAYAEESGIPIEIFMQANYAKDISVKKVELNTSIKTITIGKSFKLNTKIYPSNATDKSVTWTSEDPSIAKVDSNGNVKGIKGGKTKIVATTIDGGKVAKCLVTVHDKTTTKVKGIKLNKKKVEIVVGKSTIVTATVSPSNATNKTVTWTSSNNKVATVKNGKITGKAKGSATITAITTDGYKKAKVSVKVINNEVKSIKLNKTKESIKVGESSTLSETINPSNATNKKVKWKSSNDKIVKVNSKGKITGIKEGKAKVTVTTEDGGKKATCTITVEEKTSSKTKTILFVGNSKTYVNDIPGLTGKIASAGGYKVETKSVTKGGATLKTLSKEYSKKLKDINYDYLILQEQTDSYLKSDTSLYKSGVKDVINTTKGKSNSKIYIRALWGLNNTKQDVLNRSYNNTKTIADSVGAKVIYDGKAWDLSSKKYKYNLYKDERHQSKYGAYLSALTIYATIFNKSPIGIKYYGNLTKTEAINLQKAAHEIVFGTISVSPKNTSLQVGKVKQVKAETIPNTEVKWKSSNTKIATVNNAGVIEGKKAGTTTITASANKSSDTVVVKVQDADVLTQNSLNMYRGRYYDLNQFVQDNIGKVKWKSNNKSLAEVASNGIVHAKGNGSVNIVADSSQGEEEIKINITTQTNNKSYTLASCSSMDVKTSGTKVKLYNCLPDVELKNPYDGYRHQIQGIAVSNNYIYYSVPLNGAWLYEANGTLNNTDEATTKKITTIFIARVPRSGNTLKLMKVEYAGHGQGFDTAGLTSNGKEILYMNHAAKFREQTQYLNGIVRGTRYKGVAITTFTGQTSGASLRHPGVMIAIKGNGDLVKKKATEFQNNGKLDEKAYYKYLRNVALNNDYRANPETSVDDVNKTVATRSGKSIYVYKESDFRSGKGKPIYRFNVEDAGTQGDEISGNYFYTVIGAHDATIKKYNIKTGQKVAQTKIDFTEFLKDNAYVSMEPEGLSINNGHLYSGIVTRTCRLYAGTTCKKVVKYNTIVRVVGI